MSSHFCLPYSILLLACWLIMLQCNNKSDTDKKIFRFNQVQGVENLDPAFAKNLNIMWHIQLLYNRLLEYNADMELSPSLATHWTVSEDRKVYTFHIRNDVYFHDSDIFPHGKGRRMTAQDIAYSFQRLIDPTTASPGAWIFNDKVDPHHPFEAPNDSTFILRLQQPFNPILGILTMQYCSIVPHEAIDQWGKDFRAHPCGTGPFVLTHWEENMAITYQKNSHYWERDTQHQALPYIDGVKVSFIDSKASEFLLFMQGKLDFMNGIDATFKDQVLTKKGELKSEFAHKIKLIKKPYLNVEYLGILMDTALVQNKLLLQQSLRAAINMGFDRSKLIMYLRNNIGHPADGGIIPHGLKGYDPSRTGYHKYQPDSARKLIQQIQKTLGRKPSITLLSNDNYADRCQFIASQLSDCGLEIRIEIMQPSLLREQMSNGMADFFWATWIADYPDAESYLSMFYSPHAAPPNYTRYHNKLYDHLYEQSLHLADPQQKYLLYAIMDSILIHEAPIVPLFYDEVMHFLQPGISQWNTNSLNLIDLRFVKKQ